MSAAVPIFAGSTQLGISIFDGPTPTDATRLAIDLDSKSKVVKGLGSSHDEYGGGVHL